MSAPTGHQTQLFPSVISQLGIIATYTTEGTLEVRSYLKVGMLAPRYHTDRYAMCTDEELLTVMEATLAARQVEAIAASSGAPAHTP